MSAFSNDLSLVKNKNLIGIYNCAYTLGNYNNCRILYIIAERFSQSCVGFHVKS